MADPIDPITANPDPDSPGTFNAQAVLAWQQLITSIPQMNTAFLALNFNSTNSTSSSTDTIATGSTTITVEASKSYVKGMTIKQAYTTDPTKWMLGEVTAYNSGTGVLTHTVRAINGSGSGLTGWTVSQDSASSISLADEELVLKTNAGIGSINTAIQRYSTVVKNTLTNSATYTSSSTLGDYVTIDVAGDYEIYRYGAMAAAGQNQGVTLNSGGLTTSFVTRIGTNPEEFVLGYYTASQTQKISGSRTMRLAVNDVLRAHNQVSGAESGSGIPPFLAIKRVG